MTNRIDIVYGKAGDCTLEQELADVLEAFSPEGSFYIGYPITVQEEGLSEFDVLYTSKKFGLVVFDFSHYGQSLEKVEKEIVRHQESIYSALVANMIDRPELRKGRSLATQPQILSIHPRFSKKLNDEAVVSTLEDLQNHLRMSENLSDELYRHLNAFVQRSSSLHSPCNLNFKKSENSFGGILEKIKSEITTLDYHQIKATMETCDGPQRIRGLAGTGKTIVLALKAAKLHRSNPDWRILVTFHTKTLYQQFKTLIRDFSILHDKKEPNWDKLTIMHSWGGLTSKGVYTEICNKIGRRPINFSTAISKYSRSSAFGRICTDLLSETDINKIPKIYDAVLIDEAQDLPQSFFEVVYFSTCHPKRIIYAYDEMQSLNNLKMRPPEELFGIDKNNLPRVTLENHKNSPMQDITLDKCYRNPPWILSTALAFGFGIYNKNRIVQMFDNPNSWNDIGYICKSGTIQNGKHVHLKRKESTVPSYFEKLLDIDKSVIFKTFDSREEERIWLKDQILFNLEKDEVNPEDIMIIIPDIFEFKNEYYEITKVLGQFNFGIHSPGIVSSSEKFFEKNSIAVSNIYRAKGNEAAIVYLIGAEYCNSNFISHIRRNILFTALTRSKGWVRVTGVGTKMESLENEFNIIKENSFQLKFRYPTEAELEDIITLNDKENSSRKHQRQLLEKLFNNEISIDEIPNELKENILISVA